VEASRTAPVAGAMLAVNVLAGTPQGGAFTLDELREDLEHAGFAVDIAPSFGILSP
jgi:hypothetical protein